MVIESLFDLRYETCRHDVIGNDHLNSWVDRPYDVVVNMNEVFLVFEPGREAAFKRRDPNIGLNVKVSLSTDDAEERE